MSSNSNVIKPSEANLTNLEVSAVIHNETPAHLILKGNNGSVLTLDPLQKSQPVSAFHVHRAGTRSKTFEACGSATTCLSSPPSSGARTTAFRATK